MISLPYNAEAQTIAVSEFKPKAPDVQNDGTGQIKPETEPEPPRPTDFAMKVQRRVLIVVN